MDMRVDTTRRHDIALATDDLGPWANHDVNTRLRVWIAGFTNCNDAAVFQSDVGFDNAPVVHDQSIGQNGIHCTTSLCATARTIASTLTLRHAITNRFATTKFHFFAVTSSA